MRIPATAAEACTFAFRSYGRYVRCTHCGLIGYVIQSVRREVRPLHTCRQAEMLAKAEDWNERRTG